MLIAPLILSAVLSAFAFVLAGMSEETSEKANAEAIDSAITLTALIFIYTFTVALAGIAILWSFTQPGIISWGAAGFAAGAVGGFLVAELAMTAGGPPFVIFSAMTSVALFLMIRAIAGVGEDARR